MGAYGCWKYAASTPKRLASMIAGGGSEADAKSVAQTQIWAIHGIDDYVVPITQSEKMVKTVRPYGGDAVLTRLRGVDQGSWKVFQNSPRINLEWLFSR
jgi:predicted peptidase